MTPQELLTAAGIALQSYKLGRQYATCPHCSHLRRKHNQKKTCLSVMVETDRAYWKCHHCGWTGPEKGNGNGRTEWPTYDYGSKLRKVKRPAGGYFWQHKNGTGEWESGAGREVGGLLYRIDEVRQRGNMVLVVEGEKDVNTCFELGWPATCNSSGASEPGKAPKWTAAHSEQLRGMDVVVCGDNDDAGRAHVAAVCAGCAGVAASVSVIELDKFWDEIPVGGDISDWAEWAQLGAQDGLSFLVNEARTYVPKQAPAQPGSAGNGSHTLAELKGKVFEPLRWVIERYIPEGVTLLAGKPKIGKSWLVLTCAIGSARADMVLGEKCHRRHVLYLALEDGQRRMQSRTDKLVGTADEWPENVRCVYKIPTLDQGGIAYIEKEYLDKEPINLVILDTLAGFKGRREKNEDAYTHEYRTMNALHELAGRRGIDIIVVHHTRKAAADDVFDTVSGTYGVTAACDTMLVLTKDKDELRLAVRGRDVEPEDKVVDFDIETAEWTVTGDYDDSPVNEGMGDTRLRIMAELEAAKYGMSPKQVAEATGFKINTVRVTLKRMVASREVRRTQYRTYEPFRRGS